jgi:DNA-binding PadR family transcriptional regulator
MTKTALSLILGVTVFATLAALAACDGKTAANAKNFGTAVTRYVDKKGDTCLDPVKWPVDVYETDVRQQKLYPDGVAGQMAALEAAGLARGEDVELPGALKLKVRRYTMTDAAKPYLHAGAGQAPRLCWGRKSLDKVVRWADPAKVNGHEESAVIYTYKLSNVADWARKPAVKEAFPILGRTVDGEHTQKEKLYVKLTPQGWEALGLND